MNIQELVKICSTHPEYDSTKAQEEVTTLKENGLLEWIISRVESIKAGKRKQFSNNKPNLWVCYWSGMTSCKPSGTPILTPRRTYARPGFPDIDIDICCVRREEVIQYLKDKYGEANVANIGTINKLEAKSAIRSVVRVLDPSDSFNEANGWGKKMPKGEPNRNLELANVICESFPQFAKNEKDELIKKTKDIYNAYPDFAKWMDRFPNLFESIQALEGIINAYGRHAAAFVISPVPMEELCPLHVTRRKKDDNGDVKLDLCTMYTASEVEGLGLIKMDLLGLASETAIYYAIELIDKHYGIKIDPDNIPDNDKDTFQLLSSGHTLACFQLDSDGMQATVRTIGIDSISDLAVAIALYRPGPLQFISEYADRKKGKKKIEYLHPVIEKIAKNTYGLYVFQEQLMRLFVDLAGLTESDGYALIKAVSKKKEEEMRRLIKKFSQGCLKKGISKSLTERIVKEIEPWVGYGFNKCLSYNTLCKNFNSGEVISLGELLLREDHGEGFVLASKVVSENGELVTVPDEIQEVFETGQKELFEIALDNGMKIECTMDHKFMCVDGAFRTVEKIIKGDYEILFE